jgi:hypothetical protein
LTNSRVTKLMNVKLVSPFSIHVISLPNMVFK